MPSSRREKPKGKSPASARKTRPPASKKARRPAPARAPPKPSRAPAPQTTPKAAAKPHSKGGSKPKEVRPDLEVPLPDGRRHVLSLSFVRDGDEFLARLETDAGHITELKNRSLDQLLTLVASELEDLLE